MKIYISGPITGRTAEAAEKAFRQAECEILYKGHEPVNPYKLQNILDPETTTWDQYMRPALALVDVSDAICMLLGWQDSAGACKEHAHALNGRKRIFYGTSEIMRPEPPRRREAEEAEADAE